MDCPVNRAPGEKVDSRWRRWRARVERALIPSHCLLCGEPGLPDCDLCSACRCALPWNCQACQRCGLPLAQSAPRCGACLGQPPVYARTVAPLLYGFGLDRLLPRFKFHGDLAAGRVLAELFLDALPARALAPWPEALVPVPLHRARLRERGYDQGLELAKAWASALQRPVLPDGLRRLRATAAQSALGADARRSNVRAAFALGSQVLPRHVALVDDVMTTGATLGECARVLARGGVETIELWVVARAPPRRG